MTLETLMDEIRALPVEERKRLIGMIVDTIAPPDDQQPKQKRIAGLNSDLEQGRMSDDFNDPLPDSLQFGDDEE